MGKRRAPAIQHLQRQLVPRPEPDLPRDPGRRAATPVVGPLPGQVEPHVDQGMLAPRDVGHVEGHLAVLGLADPAAPLPHHAHRAGALLDEPRGVEDDHAVGLSQLAADLGGELLEQRRALPRAQADELLQPLALAIVEVGDRLAGLVLQPRQQAAEVLPCVPPLLGRGQADGERLDEVPEAPQEAIGRVGCDLRLGQHGSQPRLVSPIHDGPPFSLLNNPSLCLTGV
jgi:hypothetical protein